ncbi:MAG: histidine kinase, partial [Deltaproteobacteria bacterium]|nr:histidine kinase [Deltaproteobacteria bacterium]
MPARAGLAITFDEPSLPVGQRAVAVDPPLAVDVVDGSSAADGFEVPGLAWDCEGAAPAACAALQSPGGGRVAYVGDAASAGERMLVSPPLLVGGGDFTLAWKARWSFEAGYTGVRCDGAVLEFSEDGVTWVDATELGVSGPALGYAGTLAASAVNPLSGRAAMTFINGSWPASQPFSVNLGTRFAGKTVRLRFRVGTDEAVGAWGLEVDDVQVGGLLNTPFPSFLDEAGGDVCNGRPVARPGGPQSAPESVTDASGRARLNVIELDGRASSDPEGAALSYAWTQVGGPPVTLFSADTAQPTFTVDVTGDQVVTFQLVVRDGQLASVPATVQVGVLDSSNRAPVAVASAPAWVDERAVALVTLDGSGSSDADNDVLTYRWTQVSGPPVTLTGADTPQASFAVVEVAADTAYGFVLEVQDGLGAATAPVAVTVRNVDRAPTVSAGADRTVAGRAVALLGASGSDPDGDALSYQWAQVDGPAVTLANADTLAASFTAPDVKVDTALRFSVTATAGGLSATDEVVLTVSADRPPSVSAGTDRAVPGRAQVTLAAVAGDPDGDGVQLQWVQVAGPAVVLAGAQSASVTFTTPDVKAPTDVTLSVTVTANGLTASDEVVLSVA